MAKKWEAPKILAIAALPRDLGDCWDGSSPGVTSQGECGCHNGENTVGRSPLWPSAAYPFPMPTVTAAARVASPAPVSAGPQPLFPNSRRHG